LKTILLDGNPFSVRENLFNFLAQYRTNGDKSYVWIDAICIDQSSIRKRNHQVALMGKVYSKANMVIAWLGADLDEAYTIAALNRSDEMLDKQIGHALCLISGNNYWGRLWIVQEFVLCENLEVWSGYVQVDGRAFCELLTTKLTDLRLNMNDPALTMELDTCYLSNANTVATYRSQNKRMNGFRNDFISCECSNRRDRIEGLLGVLEESQMPDYPIIPDYSKSIVTLFLEVWNMWLKSMLNGHAPEREATWWLETRRYVK
jgi:hypothetical protein